MVLNELGYSITKALASMSDASMVDEAVLKACLNEIARALMQADVNMKLVTTMITNVKKKASGDLGGGLNKRKIIEKAVFDELCAMLNSADSGSKLHQPKKGKPSVVMFVGLQGSGKTTTCTKYAFHYKKKGFKPAMVCADTFRAGAFDQLKQNATKAQIPFYGSYQETDPAVIAQQGVERFKQEGRDLIIVDTSGRHKQEESLFEEMRQVAVAVEPNLVIFVMDGSIGQAAFDQAKAFKDSVAVGAVIITKMDGHAKGGGALSAVSATASPIIFLGTGEHMDEFETFEAKAFVGRLLGRGDWKSFMDKVQEVIPDEDKKEEMMEDVMKGNFTMRLLYDQLSNIMKMGSVSQLMSLIPGFSNSLMPNKGGEKEGQARLKRFLNLMDSMTDKELDTPHIKLFGEPSRVRRICRGSGRTPGDLNELLEEYKKLKTLISGKTGLLKNMPKGMKAHGANQQMNMQQMARMLPPGVLQKMGGMGALQGFMKQMEGMGK